jgi:hypothetical protein
MRGEERRLKAALRGCKFYVSYVKSKIYFHMWGYDRSPNIAHVHRRRKSGENSSQLNLDSRK